MFVVDIIFGLYIYFKKYDFFKLFVIIVYDLELIGIFNGDDF